MKTYFDMMYDEELRADIPVLVWEQSGKYAAIDTSTITLDKYPAIIDDLKDQFASETN